MILTLKMFHFNEQPWGESEVWKVLLRSVTTSILWAFWPVNFSVSILNCCSIFLMILPPRSKFIKFLNHRTSSLFHFGHPLTPSRTTALPIISRALYFSLAITSDVPAILLLPKHMRPIFSWGLRLKMAPKTLLTNSGVFKKLFSKEHKNKMIP